MTEKRPEKPGTWSIRTDSASPRVVLIAAAVCLAAGAYFSAKWGLANSASIRSDIAEVALRTAELAPSDPQTHYAAAVLLEKSFLDEDLQRALSEYEKAVALSPHNYHLWLDLGRARERSGDREGAEAALRQAHSLAPNYSRVQWALGNNLLRQGKADEGFAEIRKAVDGDPKYTGPAATTAWQIFGGSLSQVRQALGDSSRLNAALALILSGQGRYDEALEIWRAVPAELRNSEPAANTLMQQLASAKRFRDAAMIAAEVSGGGSPSIGAIMNPGFEEAVKAKNTGIFDWRFTAGSQPQIAPTSGRKHSGSNSLVLIFNSTNTSDFNTISQTVAAEPGMRYEFEIYYVADIKTSAQLYWEIVDASGGAVLARTEAVENTADWKQLSAEFVVPPASDGVTLRLGRENCGPVICPMNGNLWFDDAAIRPAG